MIHHYRGNSIEAGYGVGAELRWPKKYCDAVGATEDNQAVAGTVMTPVGTGGRDTFDINTIDTYNPVNDGYIFLGYGTNEILEGANLFDYITATGEAVDAIIAKGWPANKIVLVWNWVAQFSEAVHIYWRTVLRGLATTKHTSYLDFSAPIIADADNADYTQADQLHPCTLHDYAP